MKKILFALTTVALVACSGEADTPSDTVAAAGNMPEVEVVEVSGDQEKTVADLSISGMSCEMMCVGSIKEKLAGMDGVQSTDFPDFNGEEEINHAIVEFDRSKVSEEEMVTAIQGLFEGVYEVKKVRVEEHKVMENAPAGEMPTSTGSETTSTTSSSGLPSLADILTSFL